MPNRILREGILDSEAVNSLSEQAEIFYRRLMSIVDDYGRFEANPVVLRARLFGMQLDRWPLSRVSEVLTEVSHMTVNGQHLVLVYEVGTKKYLEIQRFNQRLRAATSRYPGVNDGHMTVICQQSADMRQTDARLVVVGDEVEDGGEVARGSLIEQTAERMYALHPKKKNKPLVELQLVAIAKKGGDLAEIEACHKLWCATDGWNEKDGQYAPKLDEWLADQGYTKRPREPTGNYVYAPPENLVTVEVFEAEKRRKREENARQSETPF